MKRIAFFDKFSCPATWVVVLAVGITFLFMPLLVQSETLLPVKAKGSSEAKSDISNSNGPPDRISVLVHIEHGADRGLIRRFTMDQGGIIKYEYKTVLPNVMNLRKIPVKAIEALERIPGVVRVVEDKYHENVLKLDESTPLINGLQSQISAAGLSADGSGIRVCVCDTGIDMDHIMYADRIDEAASYDFHNNDSNPEDDHGHGAHVAGIAVGGTGLSVDLGCEGSEPFQGVAPEATLIGAKILNASGGGYDSNIIAGIDHCADQSPSGGRADVINLSIGIGQYSGPCSHSWAVAANNAVAAGVVVVAASGNENYANALTSPACGSDVIAVGATYKMGYKNDPDNCEDTNDLFFWSNCIDVSPSVDDIVCFSNESDYLDVTAPGVVIWSASTAAGGNTITTMSGTSMAAPHVAGLAALILSADPSLTPSEVRQIIRDGAIDMGPLDFDTGYGYGRIDVIKSLALIDPCTGDSDCDDGLFCNGAETCIDGVCQDGTPINCSDSVNCTDDFCNEVTDSCESLPNNANCDDGVYCNGEETCDALNDCVLGSPVNCQDDGLFCNGKEVCDEGIDDCISEGNPCDTGSRCNEVGDLCEPSLCSNGVCDPGEDCNSCPEDCMTGGTDCSDCFKGQCDGSCNPRKDGPNCPDCASSYCCGDGVCEGDEDNINCEIDCEPSVPPTAECSSYIDKKSCNLDSNCEWIGHPKQGYCQ